MIFSKFSYFFFKNPQCFDHDFRKGPILRLVLRLVWDSFWDSFWHSFWASFWVHFLISWMLVLTIFWTSNHICFGIYGSYRTIKDSIHLKNMSPADVDFSKDLVIVMLNLMQRIWVELLPFIGPPGTDPWLFFAVPVSPLRLAYLPQRGGSSTWSTDATTIVFGCPQAQTNAPHLDQGRIPLRFGGKTYALGK